MRLLGMNWAAADRGQAEEGLGRGVDEHLKNGMVLDLDGQLWSVVSFQHHKPGKGNTVVRTKLKHVLSGKVVDKTFNAEPRSTRPTSTGATCIPLPRRLRFRVHGHHHL